MENKTHILQNANKNYLGHWDLPEIGDLVLTIKSAKWEDVENPKSKSKEVESKRIFRFKEDYKPLICNETNAKSVLKSTGIRYLEDLGGARISLFIDKYYDRKAKEEIDAIRIRVEKAPLPELLPEDTDNWNKIVKAIKDKYTFAQIRVKWLISKENESLIQKQADEN